MYASRTIYGTAMVKKKGIRTYAPASRNVFARSMSHLGSRVPADSSSSMDASPPAPHLHANACAKEVAW